MSEPLSYHALLKLLLPDDWRASQQFRSGLEREMLRIQPDGQLAQTAHPAAWGAAQTHPFLTLDFSEAQPELVTPTFGSVAELLEWQTSLHAYTQQQLSPEEALWFQSMPPQIEEKTIPLARFGHNPAGQLKHIYRQGLANRYGRKMQVISGIHFNFSWHDSFWKRLHERVGDSRRLSVFVSENYLGMIRNYLRFSWLLAYLIGATPAMDQSFIKREPTELMRWKNRSLYGPYATSLRMSRIGYVNSSRCTSAVSFNSLTDYLSTLYQSITTECPGFAIIGEHNRDGSWRQLNTHLLQIENEHYALARPKQPPEPGERPFQALRSRGVAYAEIRAIDVQPDSPIGIHGDQLEFIRLLLLYCLLSPNPPISREQDLENSYNHQQAALLGRQPGVKLRRQGKEVSLRDWGLELIENMRPLASQLDRYGATPSQQGLLDAQEALLRNPALTPSARVMASLESENIEFLDWGLQHSQLHAETLRTQAVPQWDEFAAATAHSLEAFAALEADQSEDFAAYLERFNRIKEPSLLSETD
ncbi:MAG: glutamate--cysteine ligase [Candidatus Sericytochromatia bacterium]